MNPRKRGSNSSTAFLSRETFKKKKKKIEREREGKRENPDECRLSAFDWRIAATFTPPFSAEIVPCSSKEQSLVVWPCSATCNERRGWCASVWGRTSVQDDISAAADQQTNPRHTTTTTPCTRSFASIALLPPPPLPLFISAAPSSVVGPRARNQCLLRGDSVTDVKRGDGWRVVPFASRLSHVLFDSLRDLSDQCGGRGEEGKGERSGSFLRRSLDQVVGWISVWVIIYSCVRIGFGIQGSWLMIKGTEWRGGYLLLIAWNYFEINVLIFWIIKF